MRRRFIFSVANRDKAGTARHEIGGAVAAK
jgi:hypothetical protein